MPKISVKSTGTSFRRAGLRFTRDPRELKVSQKVCKQLESEPCLQIRVLAEDENNGGKKEGSK